MLGTDTFPSWHSVYDLRVGYHISHTREASVPKTLIQHLIRWLVRTRQFDDATLAVLDRIVATRISPELVPGGSDAPTQSSEDVVGPYELQDFNLYYLSRFGYRPSKVAFLALHAWSSAERGVWPARPGGTASTTCRLALARGLSPALFRGPVQAVRLPNGPKSLGGSLRREATARAQRSPATVWLAELRDNVPSGTPRRRRR